MAAVINPTSLAEVVQGTRPLQLARDRTVPVLPALTGLMPDGGLPRGAMVGVGTTIAADSGRGPVAGATSLALALAAGPSADGSWVAVVGRPDLGLSAAAEMGVDLDRLALVDEPPPEGWAGVVAALIGAIDVVVVAPHHPVRMADARRLAARARERGTVLIQVAAAGDGGRGRAGAGARTAAGLELDLRLTVVDAEWRGVGAGHGHLQARRLTVEATGRRRAARPRRAVLWLPDPHGRITTAEPGAPTAYAGSDIDRLDDPPLREVG